MSSFNNDHNGANHTDDSLIPSRRSSSSLKLRIKTTYSSSNHKNQNQDFILHVTASQSVSELKQQVLEHLQLEATRYVRLVCHGRLLAPDAASLATFDVLMKQHATDEEQASHYVVVHAVIAAVGQAVGVQAVLQKHAQYQSELQESLFRAERSNHDNNNASAASPFFASTSLGRLSEGLLRGAGIGTDGRLIRASSPHDSDDESINGDESDEDDDEEEVDSLVRFYNIHDHTGDAEVDIELGITRPPTIASIPSVTASSGRQRRRRRQSGNAHLTQSSRRSSAVGFDRLRLAPWSLSNSQVQAIRSYFSPHVDTWLQQLAPERREQVVSEAAATAANASTSNARIESPNDDDNNDDSLHRRHLQEEAWMQAQGTVSEFWLNLGMAGRLRERAATQGASTTSLTSIMQAAVAANRRNGSAGAITTANNISSTPGSDRDFTWGFLMGFFVGFIMLAWVWMPTVPHKQKLGILSGITVQLALTMLQKGNGDEFAHDEGDFDDVGLLREY
ncbi:hypothetical protein MPSEU_000583900 [Mayamaea pseudoterrestris]|nr:hypothetical protein MPSEU_000583900 [Mayamaea pseudoterrestris]